MMTKILHEAEGRRRFAAILETGDEAVSCIERLAETERIRAASITGIGAFSEACLAYFDWEEKAYREQRFAEQLEVASLVGDIGVDEEDAPAIHVHLVLGRRDFGALAGHLKAGYVRPTLELIVTELPAYLRRVHDPETGLALIRF